MLNNRMYILSADDLGDFSGALEKSPRIVGGQDAQSMPVKKSDPQKVRTLLSTSGRATPLSDHFQSSKKPLCGCPYFRESLQESLQELWYLHGSSREMPF